MSIWVNWHLALGMHCRSTGIQAFGMDKRTTIGVLEGIPALERHGSVINLLQLMTVWVETVS
jgi:hypothetical protein